jgi:hypothetical protein
MAMPIAALADDPAQRTGANAAIVGDANAKAMAAPSYQDFLSSYSASLKMKADLSSVNDKTMVNVVKVSTLQGFKDPASLYAAMRVNKDALADLQKQIADNSTLAGKLKAAGVQPSDVVLIKTDPSPSINVFVKDAKKTGEM